MSPPLHPLRLAARHGAVLAIAILLAAPARAMPGDSPDPLGAASTGRLEGGPTARADRPGSLPAHATAPSVRERAADMVVTALHYLGVPYQRGGRSEAEGFDCSGFTRHVFEHALGVVLPRRADDQARDPGLLNVRRDELQPGDLVFFNTLRRTFSHVGIYIGEHRFVHAPRPGRPVRTDDMRLAYWSERYTGARRAPGGAERPAEETHAGTPVPAAQAANPRN